MLAPLAALLLAVSSPGADSVAADTSARRRIVREFEPVIVEGGRFSDPASPTTVHPIGRTTLRRLPVDDFADAVALRPGVVALGGELHVRGGRAGELAFTIERILLNDPWRGSPMEIPLFAVRSAELLSGGVDADHAGSLAGEVDVRTEAPGSRASGAVRVVSDGGGTGYRALHLRGTAPIAGTGLAIATAGEGRFDDFGLPDLRSHTVPSALRWRQDNHLLGWARLASAEHPQRASLDVLASRVVTSPWNPMFEFDGWVQYQPDFNGNPHGTPVATSDHQVDSTYFRYRAADHAPMTDDRRLAAIATTALPGPLPSRLTIGWSSVSMLTSIGLRHDPGYITDPNRVVFGPLDRPGVDPFHAYWGDTPLYREAEAMRWTARWDAVQAMSRHQVLRFGAGATYEWSRLWEFDDGSPEVAGFDTVRTYSGWAPGVFAYAQHRFEAGGLFWNAGLRVQSFTAGAHVPNAYADPVPTTEAPAGRTWWTWCPRLAFSYPVSTRDIFSASYSLEAQDPPRDMLADNRRTAYDRHPFGNRDVEPAQVISWQAALKHVLDPAWSMQAGVFWRDVYGQPGTRSFYDATRRAYFLRYESADNGHAGGIEFSLIRENAAGTRLEFAYTYMSAWGTQSAIDGMAFGRPIGQRPDPIADHPLDWDATHSLVFAGATRPRPHLDLSWRVGVASGLPWTPVYPGPGGSIFPYLLADQSQVNSERLPWSENTDLALRWRPRRLGGAVLLMSVANVFDNRTPRRSTLSGYPNPIVNALFDQYGAYRTETGKGGGAYWNDVNGDGVRDWVPVNDPRLEAVPRSVRVGVEVGM